MNYRHAGKSKTLAFGAYPDVSLRDARDKRDAARKLIGREIDPGAEKQGFILPILQDELVMTV